MLKKSFLYGMFVAMMATGLQAQAQAQELVINGSTTVAKGLLLPNEREVETRSSQEIRVVPSGSGHGIQALASGSADMAMISAPLGSVVSGLNRQARGSINGRDLVAHEIGLDRVAFVVNPGNPIRNLSSNQLYDILAGRITNWSQVGGQIMPIQIMAEPPGGGTRSVVESRLSEWGDHLEAHSFLQFEPLIVNGVAHQPGALGIVSAAHVDGSVAMLDTGETLTQTLYLVTRGRPDQRMEAVIQAVRAISTRLGGS